MFFFLIVMNIRHITLACLKLIDKGIAMTFTSFQKYIPMYLE